jgi:hypothetical protein
MARLSALGLAALTLASEHAFRVFPLEPRGKKPLVGGGFLAATTHPEKIAAWWDRYPDANVGLWPGASQLIVVDVDGAEGEQRVRDTGALDVATLRVKTSRGAHLYFRLPPDMVVGNVARSQVDIRAHNGYVLAPPSVHESGVVYRWIGDLDQIADVPAGVLAMIRKSREAAPKSRAADHAAPIAPRSSLDQLTEARVRNYTDRVGYGLSDGRKGAAYQLSCFYRFDVGLVDDLAWYVLSAWNRCNAPPLNEAKLREIFINSGKYGRGAA